MLEPLDVRLGRRRFVEVGVLPDLLVDAVVSVEQMLHAVLGVEALDAVDAVALLGLVQPLLAFEFSASRVLRYFVVADLGVLSVRVKRWLEAVLKIVLMTGCLSAQIALVGFHKRK